MNARNAIAILTGFLALPAFAGAAEQTFDFKDPKGVNNATFKLDAPLETITGTANGVTGTLTYDPEKPEGTRGSIVVDAKTLHVENRMMKEHLHSGTWLDTATHKEIRFTLGSVKNVKKDGDTVTADVTGKFLLHGVEKEITVPAKVTLLPGRLAARTNGAAEGDLLVVRTNFTIRRSDYGINPGAPQDKVADEIQIGLAIAGASPKK